jgi:hypothetical protein
MNLWTMFAIVMVFAVTEAVAVRWFEDRRERRQRELTRKVFFCVDFAAEKARRQRQHVLIGD